MRSSGLRIVVDCANGAAYKVAPAALWELGAEVIAIGVEPERLQHQPRMRLDPSAEALSKKVREVRADIGIALDGDADRVVIVDEKGAIVDGDQIMALIAESWHQSGRLAGGGVVATVMSNLGLERYLGGIGLQLAPHQVGDRYVVEHMRAHGFNVGGEQSGHIVLSDFTTTGDGLVAALQVLACVKRQDRPVSEVCQQFEPVPQLLKNVRFAGGKPLEDAPVKAAIDDARSRLGKAGRLVIRPSGTEPLIRVMAEGDDPQAGRGRRQRHRRRHLGDAQRRLTAPSSPALQVAASPPFRRAFCCVHRLLRRIASQLKFENSWLSNRVKRLLTFAIHYPYLSQSHSGAIRRSDGSQG